MRSTTELRASRSSRVAAEAAILRRLARRSDMGWSFCWREYSVSYFETEVKTILLGHARPPALVIGITTYSTSVGGWLAIGWNRGTLRETKADFHRTQCTAPFGL